MIPTIKQAFEGKNSYCILYSAKKNEWLKVKDFQAMAEPLIYTKNNHKELWHASI